MYGGVDLGKERSHVDLAVWERQRGDRPTAENLSIAVFC
ncbi:hypothetical protein CKA32_005180 [Geitlerinema sp. FC II]|nr:hypothetical protein CKA32_005180 [Geitlerinema sp. FC II]